MKSVAKFFSVIFHPVFVPVWLLTVLLWFADNSLVLMQPGKKIILLITFSVFMTILPLLNVMILKYMGYLTGFEMDDRKERNLPFLIGMIYYAGLYYLISASDIPLYYHAYVITGFFIVLFNYLINLKWKISSHAIGAGGFSGALLAFSLLNRVEILTFISISFLFSGVILSSRLILSKHSPAQIYVGYLSGFFLSLLIIPLSVLTLIHLLF